MRKSVERRTKPRRLGIATMAMVLKSAPSRPLSRRSGSHASQVRVLMQVSTTRLILIAAQRLLCCT